MSIRFNTPHFAMVLNSAIRNSLPRRDGDFALRCRWCEYITCRTSRVLKKNWRATRHLFIEIGWASLVPAHPCQLSFQGVLCIPVTVNAMCVTPDGQVFVSTESNLSTMVRSGDAQPHCTVSLFIDIFWCVVLRTFQEAATLLGDVCTIEVGIPFPK